MRVVLGIDAAWTKTQPSGVAVAVEDESGWRLVAVAPSYHHLDALARGEILKERPVGSEPNASDLLASATALCGVAPDLIAIDMPLSRTPITGRRVSDDKVSGAYGARHCSTHTPNPTRPGKVSDHLRQAFGAGGYPLLTSAQPQFPGLVEVYPHPALVEFARAPMRLKYKFGRARRYWPSHTPTERRRLLLEEWKRIVAVLDARLAGVADALPMPNSVVGGAELKAYEDMLDAIVCACVAICVLEDNALSYGDTASAIWIPRPQGRAPINLW